MSREMTQTLSNPTACPLSSDKPEGGGFCYVLALGSNVGDRALNFDRGLAALAGCLMSIRASARMETEPLPSTEFDVEDHPPYLNMVILALSRLPPEELYGRIRAVEDELGHPRERRWLPRHLDVDILFACIVDAAALKEGCSGVRAMQGIFAEGLPLRILPSGPHDFGLPHAGFWQRAFLRDLLVDDLEVPEACLGFHGI